MKRRHLKFILVFMFLIATNANSNDGSCPYPKIYIEIDQAYHECVNGYVKNNASCALFVEKITLLFPKYDCKRNFDTAPVPAIWLFGAAEQDYYRLLYYLAIRKKGKFDSHWYSNVSEKAKKIFLSDEFKSVLDGAIAEEYFPLIEQMKKTP